jgi:uncharacterized low-complexity protein
MRTRLGLAVVLALVLTVSMISVGTMTAAPKASGPYVAATANYSVATAAAAGQCGNTVCLNPGTTDTRCKHNAGTECGVTVDTGECYNLLCLQ